MRCYFCQRSHPANGEGWDQLHHPLAMIDTTRHCCPDCVARVLSAWDRLVGEARRDALIESLIHDHMRPRGAL